MARRAVCEGRSVGKPDGPQGRTPRLMRGDAMDSLEPPAPRQGRVGDKNKAQAGPLRLAAPVGPPAVCGPPPPMNGSEALRRPVDYRDGPDRILLQDCP